MKLPHECDMIFYQELDKELNELNKVIRNAQKGTSAWSAVSTPHKIAH